MDGFDNASAVTADDQSYAHTDRYLPLDYLREGSEFAAVP
jgi:hypothetical protein